MRLGRIALEAFLTGFSGAAMPGPVLAAAIALTIDTGSAAVGPLITLGHGAIELLLVLAVGAGLARALSDPRSRLVRTVACLGGVVLLLMAFDMGRSLPRLSLSDTAVVPVAHGPVVAGFVLSAANPYFWIWWATIGLGLMSTAMAHRGRAGMAAFYAGHISSDLAWYSLVSLLLATGRALLTDGAYRTLIGACAVMLLYFGAKFIRLGAAPPRNDASE